MVAVECGKHTVEHKVIATTGSFCHIFHGLDLPGRHGHQIRVEALPSVGLTIFSRVGSLSPPSSFIIVTSSSAYPKRSDERVVSLRNNRPDLPQGCVPTKRE